MVYLYAEHVIDDYERWVRHHEANAETRAAHGSLGTQVFRTRDEQADRTTLLVIQEIDDDRLEEALDYFGSEEFRATLEDAGVIEVRDAGLLDRVHVQDA